MKDTLAPGKAKAQKKAADFAEMIKGMEADELASLKAAIADMETADPEAPAEEAVTPEDVKEAVETVAEAVKSE